MRPRRVQGTSATSLVTFTGEGYAIRETETVQLIKSRVVDDKYPYKVVARKSSNLLAQYTHIIEALVQWEKFYAR